MSSSKQLRVPPARPSEGDTWEREDGVIFTYTNNRQGWVK